MKENGQNLLVAWGWGGVEGEQKPNTLWFRFPVTGKEEKQNVFDIASGILEQMVKYPGAMYSKYLE